MASDEELDTARELAIEAFKTDREAVAAEVLSAYVRHRTEDAYAWYVLGDCLRVIGLTEEAERALLRSLEMDPARWMTRVRLGMLCEDAGRREQAEAWYAEALADEEAQTTGYLWIFRGANLAMLRRLKEAEACHRRATGPDIIRCDREEAYLNLGLVLRAQGRYAQAGDAFRQALEICPDYPEAQDGLRSMEGMEPALALVAGWSSNDRGATP